MSESVTPEQQEKIIEAMRLARLSGMQFCATLMDASRQMGEFIKAMDNFNRVVDPNYTDVAQLKTWGEKDG